MTVTVTAPARSRRLWGLPATLRVAVALAAIVTIVLVGLAGLFAPPASAQPLTGPGNAVGAFGVAGQVVGAHQPVLAGQCRARAPSYDRLASGSCVAAETEGGLGNDLANACHSFAPATLVVLADGSTEAISRVAVGDRVRTTDPATGNTVNRTVTALHRNHDSDLADLVVRDSNGRESIVHTTQRHRFWDDTRHGWVDAADLIVGDRLHAGNGSTATVESVKAFNGREWMYDLTVAVVHTYYVDRRRADGRQHRRPECS